MSLVVFLFFILAAANLSSDGYFFLASEAFPIQRSIATSTEPSSIINFCRHSYFDQYSPCFVLKKKPTFILPVTSRSDDYFERTPDENKKELSDGNSAKSTSLNEQVKAVTTSLGEEKRTQYNNNLKEPFKLAYYYNEILSGMVVALATIPTSISYATVIGISPVMGIWNSAILGFISSLIGQAPGLIVASAGVTSLPLSRICQSHGRQYVSITIAIASLLETIFGAAKLAKVTDIVTEPVICGFLNSIGLFILSSQVKCFQSSKGIWLSPTNLSLSLAMATLCAVLTVMLSALKLALKVPPQLVAVVISTAVSILLKLPIITLSKFAGKDGFIGGFNSLPRLATIFPDSHLTPKMLRVVVSSAFGMAAVAIIETILAHRIARAYSVQGNAHNEDKPYQPNRSIVALGIANFMTSIFGGFGGCGIIPSTHLNCNSGGGGLVSSISASIWMALAVLFLAPVLGVIPMAVLAGLMVTVSMKTFEWKESLALLKQARHSLQDFFNALAMILTTVLSFKVDLGFGIIIGTIVTKMPKLLETLALTRQSKDKSLEKMA